MSLLCWAALAWAGVHVVEDGQTLEVPLNTSVGTVVQLPGAVRLVTPTTQLLVERVDPGEATAKRGPRTPVAVRHLRVRVPDGQAPEAERVTFVLADDTAVPVRFVPAGPGADPFADLQWPAPPAPHVTGGFLVAERALLAAMFDDTPHRREILDEVWAYDEVPELSWRLLRRFEDGSLTGHVFLLENLTRTPLHLDPSVLAVDAPNRAILVQIDTPELGVCGVGSAACQTLLRLVSRDAGAPTSFSSAGEAMPFVVAGGDP